MTGTLFKRFLNQKCETLHDLVPACTLFLLFTFLGTISFWWLMFYQFSCGAIAFAQIKFSSFKCFLTIAIMEHQILYFVRCLLWDVCVSVGMRCGGTTGHRLSMKIRGQLCGVISLLTLMWPREPTQVWLDRLAGLRFSSSLVSHFRLSFSLSFF